MKWKILKSILLNENCFGFKPRVTSKLSDLINIWFYEVGISYYERGYDEVRKIEVKAIYVMLKYAVYLVFLKNYHN